MDIDKAAAAAYRNGHLSFHGSVIPEIKDECRDVELLHLQAGKNAHMRPNVFVKFAVDGAIVTSHVANEKSKHRCAMMEDW